MGHHVLMEPHGSPAGILQCEIYLLLLAGSCSGLKVTVPSHTVHGIRGQALYLPVHYGFHTVASDIQIIWLFERPHTMPKYLLGSVNKSVVPDLEYQHKFTMRPPNASLLINPLQFDDEGNYIVKVNIQGNGTLSSSQKIQVTVDDPVKKPVVRNHPSTGAVEYVGNMTLTCQVEGGTRLVYQWLKNGKPVRTSVTYSFSPQNNTLHIAPVTKEDVGNYSCLVKNPVSEMESEIVTPTIYSKPYFLKIKDAVSNLVHYRTSYTIQRLEKFAQKAKSLSPLAVITGISLFLIVSMCFLFIWKKYHPYRVIKQKLEGRPDTEYRKAQTFSGHEDALDDFGIYEFVAFPDASGVCRMPSRPVPSPDAVSGQDVQSTIYEVIQHIPAQQEDHQE
ncbi:HEPACAM family member 2 [Octodon degus]|uniref:HEPACAM family member 2 n=1 Tax=Octodon degus TaxID=10160 RepID=A0A6P3FT07_OCTDE|nr:HEPACAM family member 2 [Octodon degus]